MGLGHMDFVFADDDFVTKGLTDKVAGSVKEETAVDSASDSDCDDAVCAPKPVTSAAAIAVVDTVQMFLGSSEFGQNFGSQLDSTEATILKSALVKYVQGMLDQFFQRR